MSEDILNRIGIDDSDIEVDDSDVDADYVPSSESSDDEVEKTQNRKKKRRKLSKDTDQEWDIDDDIPLAQLFRQNDINLDDFEDEAEAILSLPMWSQTKFMPPDVTFKGKLEEAPVDGNLKTPYQFFKEIITDNMIESVQEETNCYAMKKDGRELKTGSKEIEMFIGMYLRMGLMQAAYVRTYWESATRYDPVADVMARDRFETLAASLHFISNDSLSNECKEKDRVWKLRPWLNELKSSLKNIPPERHNSVDEIMIPFKGRSNVKQYMQGKPHPWGFKLWGRAGASGILYDFEFYQGAAQEKPANSIGVGGDAVLNMASGLPSGQNYLLFADNFFTSLPLIEKLKERGIFFLGTVRPNRLKGLQLKSEKELKKEGRGSLDSKVEVVSNVLAVRWFDNRAVNLVTSYKDIEPMESVKRYDKKNKEMIDVNCPSIVGEYNQFMGGIDLMDSLSALYKYQVRTKRWYLVIFYHTITMALVSSWLWYRRHCNLLQQKAMKLSCFQAEVETALIETKRPVGRPSLEANQAMPSAPKKRNHSNPVPDVRFDSVDHLAFHVPKRGRCKQCKALGYIKCVKCDKFLCINRDRNCFFSFHKS